MPRGFLCTIVLLLITASAHPSPPQSLSPVAMSLSRPVAQSTSPHSAFQVRRPGEPSRPHSSAPSINFPRLIGSTPGKPFLFLIPATGTAPFTFSARNLPAGLTLDAQTGIITGSLKNVGHPTTTTVTLTVTDAQNRTTTAPLTIIGTPNSLALTPPMGWSSWNVWAEKVDAAKIRQAADLLVSTGLAAHGYQYVNIDDCWEGSRDPDGRIQPNSKFGDIKALADYVHARGLKLGIYSSPGPKTCQGFEGSYQHERQDAMSFAAWGVDYLKYDWCSYEQRWDQTLPGRKLPFREMRKALDLVGRDIVYSICQYGEGEVWTWGAEVGGNLWRTNGDITDTWISVSKIGFSESTHAPFSGPGHWNDLDMLVVGKVGWGEQPRPTRLTPDEQFTHVSLWCLLASPLFIGCDLAQLDDFTLNLLTNDEVLAIDQDPLGRQAVRIDRQPGNVEVWARPLAGGTRAVGLFNRGKQPAPARIDWSKLGLAAPQPVRDLWQHRDLGVFPSAFTATVPTHGVILLKVGR